MIKIYYENMIKEYEKESNIKVEKNSDIELKILLLSKYLKTLDSNIEDLKSQAFLNTATKSFLDHHGNLKGLLRSKETVSKGIVTFYKKKDFDGIIIIPKDTEIQINNLDGYVFKTDEKAILAKGESEITVNASSLFGGANKNIGAYSLNILIKPIENINMVTNTTPFFGGTDVESDDCFRQRILDCYKNISNGVNKGYYENLAFENSGVYDAKLILDKNSLDVINLFVTGKKGELPEENVLEIKEYINYKKEIGRKINVLNANILTVDMFVEVFVNSDTDFLSLSKNLKNVIENYVDNLKISEKLYITQLIKLCMAEKNVVDIKINGLTENIIPLENEKILLSNIIISKGE